MGHPRGLPGHGLSKQKAVELAECQGWWGQAIAEGATFVSEHDELFLFISSKPQLHLTQVAQPSVRP